jgi:hypothetical protein
LLLRSIPRTHGFQTTTRKNTNENAYQKLMMRYTMRREIIGMNAAPFGYSLKAS